MAFLIPTLGDNRADSPTPRTPVTPYGKGPISQNLSGQNAYSDNDRYAMGLVPEPLEGNSMTQYLRSLNNWSGLSGQNVFNTGGQIAGQAGDYWSQILSGNPAAIAQSVAPTINATNSAYANNRAALDQFAPMGGGRAAQMAQLPFQKAGAISNIIAGAQPAAAQNLAQLGTTQQSLGLQQLGQALQSLLGMRGQDVTEHGQAMGMATSLAGDLMGGISSGINAGIQAGSQGGYI